MFGYVSGVGRGAAAGVVRGKGADGVVVGRIWILYPALVLTVLGSGEVGRYVAFVVSSLSLGHIEGFEETQGWIADADADNEERRKSRRMNAWLGTREV